MTEREIFGNLPDGTTVAAVTLSSPGGAQARILALGGAIQSLFVPDRDGVLQDVILGFPQLAGYLADTAHHGALIGRSANRIAGGRFTLDGCTYDLPRNSHGNTLHGGRGFDHAVWTIEEADASHVVLSHVSPDGDQGFPGRLEARVAYTFSVDGRSTTLRLDYRATTDAPTVVNLTNHAYWNLAGSGDILDHQLRVDADAFTPTDVRSIPTGEIRSVAGTPFDFRTPARLRERVLDTAESQIALAGGLDHNFVLRQENAVAQAATVTDPASGRVLEVWTDQPGVQIYSGNNLRGSVPGKNGAPYTKFQGFALETQHYPNSPNEPSFPSTVLRPGEPFRSSTEFRFHVQSAR